jgi:hypothetical protein
MDIRMKMVKCHVSTMGTYLSGRVVSSEVEEVPFYFVEYREGDIRAFPVKPPYSGDEWTGYGEVMIDPINLPNEIDGATVVYEGCPLEILRAYARARFPKHLPGK